MAKFSDEHKQEFQDNYFEQGVHKVKIQGVTLGKTDKGQEYMEFDVISEDGSKEDTARVWFTTDKALKYSFNIVKGIFVHNAPEEKKDATRGALDKIKDTEELEKACQALIGKECWFSIQKNLNRPYTAKDGSTKYSFDRNITGYKPKQATAETAPVESVVAENSKPTGEGASGDEPFGF